MTNKELFYFTGRCLALDEDPEFRIEIIKYCESDLIDWERFVKLCSNNLILQVIFVKFKSHNLLNYLPHELQEHLQEIYELNLQRNTLILKQIKEITILLNKNNVYPTFLKGAAYLLDELYTNPGERILGDIDFLVPEQDYMYTADIMKKEGYSDINQTPVYNNVEDMKHYPRMFHPDFVSVIEIHRIPVRENYLSWFNTAIIDQEKTKISTLKGCFIPSARHKIIHNFIHGQLSNEGYLYGTISLREIYDLYLLSKRSSLTEALSGINPKRKAIAYFSLAGNILGLSNSFFAKKNIAYQILLKKHSLYMSSGIFYTVYRSSVFIAQRIFVKYLGQITDSFFSAKMRKSVYDRLSTRSWYGDHLTFLTRFLNRKR